MQIYRELDKSCPNLLWWWQSACLFLKVTPPVSDPEPTHIYFGITQSQVCESGPRTHFVPFFFFPGKSHCRRWRYCFSFTALNPSVFCSNPFRGCQLAELCSLSASRAKENKYQCSYRVSGSNNNIRKESTTNRKILWYKIRQLRFSTEMYKVEGISVCLICLLISLHADPPFPIQTQWPALGRA